MRNKGDDYLGAAFAAKRFIRRRCPHKTAIAGEEYLVSVIGENNQHRYYLVSQSLALNKKMENIVATPIIHFVKDTLVLQPLSRVIEKAIEELDQQKFKPSDMEIKILNKINNTKIEEQVEEVKATGKRKPKAPNPLSVKKKKKETGGLNQLKDKKEVQQNKESNENEEITKNNKDSILQKERSNRIKDSTEVDYLLKVITQNNIIDNNNEIIQLDKIIDVKQDKNKGEQDIQILSNKKKRKRKPHSHNKKTIE